MDDKGTLYLPPPSSTIAGEVDALFYFIFYASMVLFAIVMMATVYFIFRYRRRGEKDRRTTLSSHTMGGAALQHRDLPAGGQTRGQTERAG